MMRFERGDSSGKVMEDPLMSGEHGLYRKISNFVEGFQVVSEWVSVKIGVMANVGGNLWEDMIP